MKLKRQRPSVRLASSCPIMQTYLSCLRAWTQPLLPGLLLSVTVGSAAGFLGIHYDAPVMLFALLLGMAFNFLHADGPCRAGVDFASRFILRLGVGLLGIRIAIEDLAQVGLAGAATIAGLIALTIVTGLMVDAEWSRCHRCARGDHLPKPKSFDRRYPETLSCQARSGGNETLSFFIIRTSTFTNILATMEQSCT